MHDINPFGKIKELYKAERLFLKQILLFWSQLKDYFLSFFQMGKSYFIKMPLSYFAKRTSTVTSSGKITLASELIIVITGNHTQFIHQTERIEETHQCLNPLCLWNSSLYSVTPGLVLKKDVLETLLEYTV